MMSGVWQCLPHDILTQHIMPFTYRTQPAKLVRDIRSFHGDVALTEEYYSHNFNHFVWLNDIINYFTLPHLHSTKTGVEKILRRHVYYRDMTEAEVRECVFNMYYKHREANLERKVRFLWALLLPVERTQFINQFIIE